MKGDDRATLRVAGGSTPTIRRVAVVASDAPVAQTSLQRLCARYPTCDPTGADVVVALGGDGFMLDVLHRHLHYGLPVYGMNCGTVGFLMNEYEEDGLLERLTQATVARLRPLRMSVVRVNGEAHEALAINEVSLHRTTQQATRLRITVDGTVRLTELVGDGALVATPAGSTAYNLSAHGPILPLGSPLLALTPVSAFRPRRWRGALLPASSEVCFDVLEAAKRPVSAAADSTAIHDVARVTVHEDPSASLAILFDADHNLEERILREQFAF